jgi:hypothetical protein
MFCTDPQESAEATESVLYAEPMNLPLQLPYNPTLKLIALQLGGRYCLVMSADSIGAVDNS